MLEHEHNRKMNANVINSLLDFLYIMNEFYGIGVTDTEQSVLLQVNSCFNSLSFIFLTFKMLIMSSLPQR